MDALSPQALANHSGIGLVDGVSCSVPNPFFHGKIKRWNICSFYLFPIGYIAVLVSTDILPLMLLTACFVQRHASGGFFLAQELFGLLG
jgi:hypothetical protein